MLGIMTTGPDAGTIVHCRHCGQLIREHDHPGIRWVHVHSGAGYCAAESLGDARRIAREQRARGGRRRAERPTMAEPE